MTLLAAGARAVLDCQDQTDDLVCSAGLAQLRAMAPQSAFGLCSSERLIGYVGIVPGTGDYAHGALYISPVARTLTASLRSLGRAAASFLLTTASARGYAALAVNPTTPGQLAFALACGAERSNAVLPFRGPIVLWRFGSTIPAEEIALHCFPEAFARAQALERLAGLMPRGLRQAPPQWLA